MCIPQYSRGTGPLAPGMGAGWLCPTAELITSMSAAMLLRSMTRLPRTGVLDGGAEAGDHPLGRPFTDDVQSVVPQAPAHGLVADDLVESLTESGRITLGNDEAVGAVLNQPTRGRSD